LPAMG